VHFLAETRTTPAATFRLPSLGWLLTGTALFAFAQWMVRNALGSRLLDGLEWVGVDDDLAERAGTLAQRFIRSHPGVDPVDYVIAASAQRLEAELWTKNLKHFPMFSGLRPPY